MSTEPSRPHLTLLTRSTRYSEPELSPRANLLPRRVFENDPDTLELYDKFERARAAVKEHSREAGKANIAAEAATTAYQQKVRDAIANGRDVAKVKNDTDRYTAEAKAHLDLVRIANHEVAHTARALGARIGDIAGELLEPSEERIDLAAEAMRDALDQLSTAWSTYSLAWQERTILGRVALYGGLIANYDPNPTFPGEVRDAIKTLTDHLNDLARLKQEEQIIRSERPEGVQI